MKVVGVGASIGLVWFGLVWLGLAWFGFDWLGLVWFASLREGDGVMMSR